MNIPSVITFIFIINLHQAVSKKYVNYTLYRGIPVNEMHLNFFRNLSKMYDVSFWRNPGTVNKPVDFMISPDDQPTFIQDAEEFGLYVTTIIENVQQAFDQQTVKTYIRRRTDSFDWYNYFRVNDIYSWLKDLCNIYPKKIKCKSLGRTFENRDIVSVKINHEDAKTKNWKTDKTKVIIEGGIHAREWISTAFVTYLINSILRAPFAQDAKLKKIAYEYEWHFVPVLNPDGYEYTHTVDRMWRKNRNQGYMGVDVNRNFDYNFGSRGISFEPSHETYCGTRAFSEEESKAMAKLVKANSQNLGFYFAFHAYGQYMIIPYADTKYHLDNFNEVNLMALEARQQLQKRFGTLYTSGTAYDTVGYMTSGISGDWVKKNYHTKVVCTFELRDNGRYGFALPPSQILPTCQETMDAMISFLTPRKKGWEERLRNEDLHGKSVTKLLDTVVVVCNVILFIIVRFD